MRLTMFTDYGMRSLIFLALRPDGLSSIAEIARAYAISENHVVKVVHALGRAGFVETIRGRNGGLRLARSASDIRLGEIVRAMEPGLALVACQDGEPCAISGVCRLEHILDEAVGALLAVLDRHTLADVADPSCTGLKLRLGIDAPI